MLRVVTLHYKPCSILLKFITRATQTSAQHITPTTVKKQFIYASKFMVRMVGMDHIENNFTVE